MEGSDIELTAWKEHQDEVKGLLRATEACKYNSRTVRVVFDEHLLCSKWAFLTVIEQPTVYSQIEASGRLVGKMGLQRAKLSSVPPTLDPIGSSCPPQPWVLNTQEATCSSPVAPFGIQNYDCVHCIEVETPYGCHSLRK